MQAVIKKVVLSEDKPAELIFHSDDPELSKMTVGQIRLLQEKPVDLFFNLRLPEPDMQTTLDDAMRENERIAKIRRILYHAIEGMEEIEELDGDTSDAALSLAICTHFEGLTSFQLNESFYVVRTGESGNLPQLWIATEDGEVKKLIIEGSDLIKEVRWILENPADTSDEPWKPEIVNIPDYMNNKGIRFFVGFVDPENPKSELGFYTQLTDGTYEIYQDELPLDLEYPLTREDAKMVLASWAKKRDWTAVPPEGYGTIYLSEAGNYYLVLRDEEDEEGWPVFRAHICEPGNAEPHYMDRDQFAGCNTPEEAQKELDEWVKDWEDIKPIGYAKFPSIPTDEEEPDIQEVEAQFCTYADNEVNRYFVGENTDDAGTAYCVFKIPFGMSTPVFFGEIETMGTAEEAQTKLDAYAAEKGWEVFEPKAKEEEPPADTPSTPDIQVVEGGASESSKPAPLSSYIREGDKIRRKGSIDTLTVAAVAREEKLSGGGKVCFLDATGVVGSASFEALDQFYELVLCAETIGPKDILAQKDDHNERWLVYQVDNGGASTEAPGGITGHISWHTLNDTHILFERSAVSE
jgi:hypothetical protein